MRTLAEEISHLQAELFIANQKVRMMMAEIFGEPGIKEEWDLKPIERRVVSILRARPGRWISKDALRVLLGEDFSGELRSDAAIFGHVSRARHKLIRFGIRIESIRNLGYRLVEAPQPKSQSCARRPTQSRSTARQPVFTTQGDLFSKLEETA